MTDNEIEVIVSSKMRAEPWRVGCTLDFVLLLLFPFLPITPWFTHRISHTTLPSPCRLSHKKIHSHKQRCRPRPSIHQSAKQRCNQAVHVHPSIHPSINHDSRICSTSRKGHRNQAFHHWLVVFGITTCQRFVPGRELLYHLVGPKRQQQEQDQHSSLPNLSLSISLLPS